MWLLWNYSSIKRFNFNLGCQHQVKKSSCKYEGRQVTRTEKFIDHSRTGDGTWSDVPPNFQITTVEKWYPLAEKTPYSEVETARDSLM